MSDIEAQFETEAIGDVRVIRMPADMPAGFAEREPYRRTLAKLIEHSAERKLVINLREAPFYDSMSIGFLVATDKQLRDRGFQCRFCNISQQTRWAVEITQLNRVLGIYPDEEAALAGY